MPYLKTIAEGENVGAWCGGGYWSDRNTLLLNSCTPIEGEIPFRVKTLERKYGGEDLSVFIPRMERDGWTRIGPDYGHDLEYERRKPWRWINERVGDDGWRNQPSAEHPTLKVHYKGYLDHGYTFKYTLEDYPDLIDEDVDSACWDNRGNLIFSKKGAVYRYSLADLHECRPGFVLDLEPLTPRCTQEIRDKPMISEANEEEYVQRIISGGQTGADRAALDVALGLGIECGGWVPKGRLAEDGAIPEWYPNLVEADSPVPDVRTELNVRDSDATLIFSRGPLTGGSAFARDVAARLGKPNLHVDLAGVPHKEAVATVRRWLGEIRRAVLNVAGPRASGDPEIYGLVKAVLLDVLAPDDVTDTCE